MLKAHSTTRLHPGKCRTTCLSRGNTQMGMIDIPVAGSPYGEREEREGGGAQ